MHFKFMNTLLTFLSSVIVLNLLTYHEVLVYANGCPNSTGQKHINTKDQIEKDGYPAEEHVVQTEDGFLLTIFRIPPMEKDSTVSPVNYTSGKPSKHPVFLMHGIFGSSDTYFVGKNGFGFQLARRGFDVWIGNIRGNAYSRNHTKLSPNDKDFWDFSYHEMGVYDLPASIDYILGYTNNTKLHYVGISMGTTVFFVMGSMKPEYNNKILTMIALAPIARLKNVTNVEDERAKIMIGLANIGEERGKYEMFPRKDFKCGSPMQIDCDDLPAPISKRCSLNYQLIALLGHGNVVQAGSSVKTVRHFIQLSQTGMFKAFDYGNEDLNNKKWNSSTPPMYDLKKVTAPMAIFYTPTDYFISVEDSEATISTLPNVIKIWKAPDNVFTHIDFLITTDAKNIAPKRNMTDQIFKMLEERNVGNE